MLLCSNNFDSKTKEQHASRLSESVNVVAEALARFVLGRPAAFAPDSYVFPQVSLYSKHALSN